MLVATFPDFLFGLPPFIFLSSSCCSPRCDRTVLGVRKNLHLGPKVSSFPSSVHLKAGSLSLIGKTSLNIFNLMFYVLNSCFWSLKCVLIWCSCLETKELSWNSIWNLLDKIWQQTSKLAYMSRLRTPRVTLKCDKGVGYWKLVLKRTLGGT